MNFKWLDFLLQKLPFGGNLSLTLCLTLLIFLVAVFLKKPLHFLIKQILKKIAQKNTFFQSYLIRPVEKPIVLISTTIIWLLILNFLPPLWKSMGGILLFLSTPIIAGIKILIKLIIGGGLIWLNYNLVDVLISDFIMKRFFNVKQDSSFHTHFMPFIIRFVKALVICFGSLLILQSLGINVLSLMAGLGIGGIALALAAKDSVSNILAYINLMLDKPFSVGDWISFNDMEGTVLEVGIRSSKIKTFYDSIITIPNSVLTSANIDNIGKRKSRRTRIYLGVEYKTEPEKIKEFIEGIKKILLANESIKKDYFQVYLNDFGASDLKIMMNFFLTVSNWEQELQEKQNIYMEILTLAKNLKVNFAFPTQSIYMKNLPSQQQGNK